MTFDNVQHLNIESKKIIPATFHGLFFSRFVLAFSMLKSRYIDFEFWKSCEVTMCNIIPAFISHLFSPFLQHFTSRILKFLWNIWILSLKRIIFHAFISRFFFFRFVHTASVLKSICWHMEGKQFVCSHADGSLVTWQLKPAAQAGEGLASKSPVSIIFPHGKKDKETGKVRF